MRQISNQVLSQENGSTAQSLVHAAGLTYKESTQFDTKIFCSNLHCKENFVLKLKNKW